MYGKQKNTKTIKSIINKLEKFTMPLPYLILLFQTL